MTELINVTGQSEHHTILVSYVAANPHYGDMITGTSIAEVPYTMSNQVLI